MKKTLTSELSDKELEKLHSHLVKATSILMGKEGKKKGGDFAEYDILEVALAKNLCSIHQYIFNVWCKRHPLE